MKITLIRHSKTKLEPEKPITLWGLSEEGIELAKGLSEKQVIKDVDALYSSLQTKAIETALYLAKPNSIPLKTNEDLTEITSFTLKFFGGDQYMQNVHDFFSGKVERIAEGETYKEALVRFNQAIQEIVEKEKVDNIGIVSHGNILSFFTEQNCEKKAIELHDIIKMPDVAVLDWDTKNFIQFWGEHI